MSRRMAAIGVDRRVDEAVLLAAFARVAARLDDQSELPDELLARATTSDSPGPLRWIDFRCRYGGEPDLGLNGSFVLDILGETIPELVWVVHDDSCGQHSFLHLRQGARILALRSDGPYVDRIAGELEVDHPQRGFDHDALRALHGKPEEALTEAEAAAIMDYDGAITLGLRQQFPGDQRGYLQLGYGGSGWWLARRGRLVDPPEPADPDVASRMPAGLSPRHPSAPDAPPRTWDDWFVRARNRWAAGDQEGAFADTLRARREDPDQVSVHVQLATLGHHGHGDAAEALASIEALHARGVRYESMGTHASRILFLLGRYAQAAEVLDRQVAQAPDDDFTQYNLACYAALASGAAGSEAERASHRARALAALERAIALSPGNAADAAADPDFEPLRDDPTYRALVEG